jgi:hypothetical protein
MILLLKNWDEQHPWFSVKTQDLLILQQAAGRFSRQL